MRIAPETNLSLNGVVNALFSKQACDKIDKEKLIVGILVELEHTSDKEKAKKIATDHLLENPDYYTDSMKDGWGTEEALDRINELTRDADSENLLLLFASLRIRLQPSRIPGEILVFKSDSKKPSFRMFGIEMQDVDINKVREFLEKANIKDDNIPLLNGSSLFKRDFSNEMEVRRKGNVPLELVGAKSLEGSSNPVTQASVFILEDDPERIEIFKRAFGSSNVVSTQDVKEAINLLRVKKFAKVFLGRDLSNNVKNGEDVAWQMEQEKLCSDTPVVIHSENTHGQKVMARYIGRYHSDVSVVPFRELKKSLEIAGGIHLSKHAE